MDFMNNARLAFYCRTKFLGPTNYRGSRVKAVSAGGKSVTVDWDHAANSGNNHAIAFHTLLEKLGLAVDGDVLVNGGLDDGYVFMVETRDA